MTITSEAEAGSDLAEAVVRRYAALDDKVQMTLDEAIRLSEALATRLDRLEPRPRLVVGIANGGLLPAKVVADRLGLPLEIIRIRKRASGLKQMLGRLKRLLRLPVGFWRWGPVNRLVRAFDRRFNRLDESRPEPVSPLVQGSVVALVDDCIDSGQSLIAGRRLLLAAGAMEVRTAAICWSDRTKPGVQPMQEPPDVHLHRRIHYYPWSVNSPDFDAFEAWLARNGLRLWR